MGFILCILQSACILYGITVVCPLFVSRDASSSTTEMTAEERREQQKKEEMLHASSLRVPRR